MHSPTHARTHPLAHLLACSFAAAHVDSDLPACSHTPIAPFAQPELAILKTKDAANEHALEVKGADLAKTTVNCAAAPPAEYRTAVLPARPSRLHRSRPPPAALVPLPPCCRPCALTARRSRRARRRAHRT